MSRRVPSSCRDAFARARKGMRGPKARTCAALALALLLSLALAVPAAFAAGPGVLVDNGFESGVDGALLASPPWGANGTPQHREYDNARAKTGSMSAWIQGPAAASNAGAYETATGGMTSNASEMTFWLYLDTTTQSRLVDEYAPGVLAADRAFSLQFATGGAINVQTDRAGNPNGYTTAAYTPVGTYSVGWTQYRIVYDFSSQTYTLSKRSNAGDAWTQLKAAGAAGYNIPFKGTNTVTTTHGTLWRGYNGSQMWIDDLTFADGGIVPPDVAAPSAPSTLVAIDHPADAGGAIDLSWTASIDNVGVTGYRLYRGTAPGIYTTPTLLGNVTSYTDATATTGTRYYYAISAIDAAGNESAKSNEFFATAADNTTPPPSGLTLVDAGFESGADGALLASPPWGANGTPQHREYDNTRAKTGSMSAWIQGPAAASNAGAYETATGNMTAAGSEMTFWLYLDTTTGSRLVDEYAPGVLAADRAFSLQFATGGAINVQTDRAGNPNGYTTAAYTPVGTYSVGWTQYRIVYDFSSQTYTLSKRGNAGDAWTQLKAAGAAGYNIPFKGTNTVTTTHGTLWRGYNGSQMWIDDLSCSAATPPPADTTPPSAPLSPAAIDRAADQGSAIDLSWAASIDNVGVTGYRLYRGTTPGAYAAPVALGNVTTYADVTCTPSTTYYYAISAVDAAGNESAKSTEVFATATDNLAPGVPSGLSAIGGSKQVALSWSANVEPDIAGYDVYRNGVKVNTTPVLGTTFTDTGLADSTAYSYRLSALDTHGNASAQCAAVSATTSAGTVQPPSPGTLVDAGFESGTEGSLLASPPWAANGTPQHREYDNARAKVGSQSAWIQGPTTATNAGAYENATGGMNANGAEMRFWVYLDTTNQSRLVDEYAAGVLAADRAFSLQFATNGNVNVLTDRAGSPNGYTTSAYTPVGTYAVGWTQYRIVYDFSSQTYTLSKRAAATDAWTQMKAAGATGYAIPFKGTNTITATHGTLWRGLGSAQMWLDDIAYSNTGINDPAPTNRTVTASAGAGGSITPAGAQTVADGGSVTFTIAAASGYDIASVLVDGASVGTPGSYTFTNVTADHTIAASFSARPVVNDMPITYVNCDRCHAVGSALDNHDHPCENCHEITWGHPDNGTQIHTPAVVTTCTPCHNASLTLEHKDRTPNAGGTFACATCHESTDPAVRAAITAKNSACSACHANANHQGLHGSDIASQTLPATGLYCGQCHDADLQVEHAKPTASSAASGCSNCHPSPRNTLTSAWNKGCSQNGCHAVGSSTEMHGGATAAHTPLAGNSSCFGTGCHSGSDLTAIHSTATTTVAGVVRTSCMVCHAGGTPTSKDCTSCHTTPGTTYHAQQNATHVSATNATCFGAGCHDASKRLDLVHDKYVGAGAWFSQYATSCELCHKNTSPTRINWGLTVPNERCTGTCHTSNHTRYSSKHTPTAASAACTGCHGTDLTGIHKAYADLSRCGTLCHDNKTNWSKSADCASCHSASIHDGLEHNASGTDAGVPSTGGLACSTCHYLSVSATTTDTVAEHTKTSSRTSANGAISCTTCHSASYFPAGWNAGAPATNTCVSCHATGKAPAPHTGAATSHDFGATAQNADYCGTGAYCHGGAVGNVTDVADLHAASRPGNGSCTVCHSQTVPSKAACTSCHGMHHDSLEYHSTTSASDECLSCHTDKWGLVGHAGGCPTCHANPVLTANGTRYLKGTFEFDCTSCHNGVVLGTHAYTPVDLNHYPASQHEANDGPSAGTFMCSDCHDMGLVAEHAVVKSQGVESGDGTVTCAECHTNAFAKQVIQADWALDPLRARECGDCHTDGGLGNRHQERSSSHAALANPSCQGSACHGDVDIELIHQTATDANGNTSCKVCHTNGADTDLSGAVSCGQVGGCHETMGVDFHTNMNTAHTSTSPTCYSIGCHAKSRLLPDVHADYVGPGSENPQYTTSCQLCHNNQDPNRINWTTATASCVSCHPAWHGAAPGDPVIHGNRDALHTPTAASDACVGCHSASLPVIHGAYYTDPGGCTSCHMVHADWNAKCAVCHAQKSNWSKTADCVSCHDTSAPHGDTTARHAIPAVRSDCLASGCHDAGGMLPFEGKGVDEIHSQATTTTAGGQTRTTCWVCHTAGVTLTTDCLTSGCHPDRANPHGYVAEKHASTETCLQSCHTAELAPAHAAQVTATTVACSGCHATLVPNLATKPWNGQCSACHSVISHATADHAGTDAQVRVDRGGKGCSDTGTANMNCHDISNVSALHAPLPGKGCAVCHGPGKTPQRECRACHPRYDPPTSQAFGNNYYPTADGPVVGTTTNSSGTTRFDLVDEANPGDADTTYFQFTSPGSAMFSATHSIPDTATIQNVIVYARARTGSSTTKAYYPMVSVGGTSYSAAATNVGATYTGGSGVAYTLTNNPKTGAAWTPAELNATGGANTLDFFGVGTSNADATANGYLRVTQCYLVINYSVALEVPEGSLLSANWYHHNNVRYFYDPADAAPGAYYGSDPAHGWNDALYYQDCSDFCHRDIGGEFPVFSAYGGKWMWYTTAGAYFPETRTLTLAPITVPGDAPKLEFQTNWRNGLGADAGYVEVSTDGGATFTPLTGTVGGTSMASITGDSTDWVPATYDLSAYSGQSAIIRFRFEIDDGEVGWAFDNLTISNSSGTIFSDDAETLKPEWTNYHWTRSMSAYPMF